MRVCCRHYLGPCHVHPRVNGEGRLIDFAPAFHDYALLIDQHQVRYTNVPKVHAKGIHPEMVLQLGVASRDVPRDSFAETKLCEEPKSRSQTLLAVQTFLRH